MKDGLCFRAAVRKLGVSPATLNQHFRADEAFHEEATRVRARGLHGPAPDTSWHPRLPPLLAAGLSIPKAAEQLGKNPITVRNHLGRFPNLHAAVDESLRQAGARPVQGRELAFIGLLKAEPDLATRVEEILRFEG
ncbi:hypothetical protein AB0M95_00535 [Sphaerisporangium sp. NPDC051017]|uniref:hypothetical protein n=1 Tax=Sphaerisporangium sp. NPDC051017 TaxID=3154636 RepID=UPI003430ADCF